MFFCFFSLMKSLNFLLLNFEAKNSFFFYLPRIKILFYIFSFIPGPLYIVLQQAKKHFLKNEKC